MSLHHNSLRKVGGGLARYLLWWLSLHGQQSWIIILRGRWRLLINVLHASVVRASASSLSYSSLWSVAFTAFGVIWVMPRQVIDLMFSWKGQRGAFGCHQNQVVWQANPHCIMQNIWGESIHRTFEDDKKLMQDIKRTLFEYCIMIQGVSCSYLVDLLGPYGCSFIIL